MRRRTLAKARAEDGAATVLALAIVGALMALSAGFLAVLAGTVASQLAANAADAAALAAADAVSGFVVADPCGIAAEAARRNGARLRACDVAGPVASVTVAVIAPFGDAVATGRAGPPGWRG
ncbi:MULTISPECIES: Rv3654c family TadE-like protein [unclassified Agromyces]|uniref:Rv3654c family TadE-like protein n=1 Tax=unclassified Agromyces TaxID=2639701 RepID=UPI0030156C1D